MPKLAAGDIAPPFRGQTTDGKEVSLSDFSGKKLVLYFYPKDDTPGCTAQACSLRDHISEIRAKGAEVLGVSKDTVASHQKFTQKHRLNFPLLADADGVIGKAYGTISGLIGLVGLNQRWTFVIDEKGRIAHVFNKVDARNHADEVLAVL
jgi:peroxiredoxin Q/BCP